MQNSVAKKIFAVGSAVAMTLSLAVPFAANAAAHIAGSNVSSSDGTVWFITSSNTRRAYTSAGAFLSYGFNAWSQVVPASAEDLALPVDSMGFIPPADGTVFCATTTKASDVKGECSLVTAGTKAAFTSAAVFTGLGFSFSRAQYGDSSFLNKSANVDNTTSAHRTGVLVNNNGTVQLVGANGLLGIPDMVTFNSWGYSFNNVVAANAADKAMTQTGVMTPRTAGMLNPSWNASPSPSPTPTPGVISGSVSASLSSDTPASGTIAVTSSSTLTSVVTLGKFTFSGSGTVTQVMVKRIGVSPDTIITNAYLYDGGTRLTDAASVGGSSTITFQNPNGLFTVNGSKNVSVVVEVVGNAGAGQTVGVQLVSYTVANGSPMTASISGNIFTTSTATDLAYSTFGSVTPTGGSFDPAKDIEVFHSSVTVNQRDMTMSRLIMRNIGSVQMADINNFRLKIDGTQVAQTQSMDGSGYVYFNFSPVTLKSGTRVFSVLADIIAGSSRNFQYQIRNKADVDFMDTQYNTSVAPSNTFPVGSASSNSINSGSITFQKTTDSPTGNVTDGSSNVTLAKYTVTAYGEAMKVETLTIAATSSDNTVGSLRNGRILINGTQYGSTATLNSSGFSSTTGGSTYSAGGTQYTLNYTLQPGVPVTLEIHADLFDNDGVNQLGNNDTVTAVIEAGSSNVQRLVSLGYTNGPSAYVLGNNITDVTGSVTFSRNATYANQTIPLPQTGYKLASFNLVGSSSEDVNINSIAVDLGNSSTSLVNLTDVTLKVNGSVFGTIKGTLATGTASSTYSGNFKLDKNATVPVEVYASIPTPTLTYNNDTFNADVSISGTTANSSAAVSSTANGQTISVGSATILAAQDPVSPVAAIVAGNQTKTAAAFKFTTANDAFTINELTLSVFDATNVTTIRVKDGTNTVATQAGAASSTLSNLSIPIAANSTKVLTVELDLGNTGFGAGTSGANVKITLHGFKYTPSSSGALTTATSTQGTGSVGNNTYVFKAIPTITNLTLPSTALVSGVNTLAKFSISSGGSGAIGWTHFVFNYATSNLITLASPQIWDSDAQTQITASSSVNVGTKQIVVDTATEQQVSGAKNYVLKATVGGPALVSGDYVSTSIPMPSTSSTPISATTATGTVPELSLSFLWSDLSAQSHSFTTYDWNNDYLVKNLPTDSQTLTK